eukprot:879319-Lingulodinium_polyedra.AAC.1
MVAYLGEATLAKGLARVRKHKRIPAAVERAARALDAASAMIRHPGTAAKAVSELKACVPSELTETRSDLSSLDEPPDADQGHADFYDIAEQVSAGMQTEPLPVLYFPCAFGPPAAATVQERRDED